MRLVGIFGGTFNPIHYGHLHMAQALADALTMDEVKFIPSANHTKGYAHLSDLDTTWHVFKVVHCNQALAKLVHEGLEKAGLPKDVVQVVETTDRAAVGELITMKDYVDVIVPRGGCHHRPARTA